MTGLLKMPEGMLILCFVAATNEAADETHAESRPSITSRYAVLANLCRRLDLHRHPEMGARPRRELPCPCPPEEHIDDFVVDAHRQSFTTSYHSLRQDTPRRAQRSGF